MADTVVDTMAVDTDTVDTVDTTVASAPLMLRPRPPLSLNPKLMLMPTTDTTVIPDTTVATTDTAVLTHTVDTTVASAPLRLNPNLITVTAMDTAVDTTVDTEA